MPHPLGTILNNLFNKTDNWKLTLLEKWPDIIGNLHNKVIIEKIYEDTIVLGAYDACWMHELYMLSTVILKRINATLDQPRIKHVRFKMAVTLKRKPTKKLENKISELPMLILSPRETQTLATIKDLNLQAALRAFLIRCYQEKA